MTALVTGGAGFLGRHVVAALLASGESVRVLDLRENAELPPEVDLRLGSVTDPEAVAQAMQGVRRVFHLAAIPELWVKDKAVFDRVNHRGTRVVLEAARDLRNLETFVHTSSEVVLVARRGLPLPEKLDEAVQLEPEEVIGPYARSKRRAELAVLEAAREGLPAKVVIPTMPMGPGDTSSTPPTRMLADLLAGRTPAYAEVMLNIVDARDAAAGHLLTAERGQAGARYLLSGHNRTMSALLRDLAPLVEQAMPRRRVPLLLARWFSVLEQSVSDRITGIPPTAPRDGVEIACQQRPFENALAVRELGFAVRPLKETLADAVDWLAVRAKDANAL